MLKLLRIVPVLLLCTCFAAWTPATAQYGDRGDRQVSKAMLEFANDNSAKIAWTSRHGEDLVIQYSTDPNNFNLAVDAIEHSGGDNHRGTIINLRPHTVYYVRMTDKRGQPVGPVFSFRTTGRHEQPIHEQRLEPAR
jgi:Purple acid Phosphatase, N-terminal domain